MTNIPDFFIFSFLLPVLLFILDLLLLLRGEAVQDGILLLLQLVFFFFEFFIVDLIILVSILQIHTVRSYR